MDLLVDLHNHSCLSPCGDLSLSPSVAAEKAAARGIGLLALTDHNSALDCPAFAAACARCEVLPLFGLELNSAEEAHLLALFPTPLAALAFGAWARDHLPQFPWDPERLGDQPVVDEEEGLLGFEERWLGAALDLSFDELGRRAAEAGAIVIPAHVDRPMNSVGSQLGFLPEGPWDAVESMRAPPAALSRGLTAISGSDAHYPEHIGRRPTGLTLPGRQIEELREALNAWIRAAEAKSSSDQAESPGAETLYQAFLADERLAAYPAAEAEALFSALRSVLEGGEVRPGFLPEALSRPSAGRG